MGHIRNSLFKMLLAFQGLATFIPIPSQAMDFRDDMSHPVVASVSASVAKMCVETGQRVTKGTRLCTLEAMKMEFCIFAPFSGRIGSIFFKAGDEVAGDTPLMTLLPPESASASSSPSPSHTPPSGQGQDNKALSVLQDDNDQQAPAPLNVFPPSLSGFSTKNPDPFSGSPASAIAPDSLFSSPLAFPVIPGATLHSPPSSPPDIDDKPTKSIVSGAQGNATGIVGGKSPARPIPPVQPQESSIPSGKTEKPSFKKDGQKGTAHSLNEFPNGFLQRLPQESFKPAQFGDAGYFTIMACAKWTAGLVALACLFLSLKTVACSLLISPLSRITWLRAMDVNRQGLAVTPQRACNRNRIGKRKVALRALQKIA